MMGFMNDLNGKLQSFMMGRNGSDRLARWALGAAVIVLIVNMLIPNPILMAISYALLFYSVYRMFSSNIPARTRENERFEAMLSKLPFFRKGNSSNGSARNASTKGAATKKASTKGAATKKTSTSASDPEKIKVTCESCGQSLSVPKGRGTLKVTCPKCSHQMKVKS